MRQRRTKVKIRVACRAFLEGRADAIETCWTLARHDCRKNVTISEKDLAFIDFVYRGSEKRAMLLENWHPSVLPQKLTEYERIAAAAREEMTMICNRILTANPRNIATREVEN